MEDRNLHFFERGTHTNGPHKPKRRGEKTSLMSKKILNTKSKGDDKVLEKRTQNFKPMIFLKWGYADDYQLDGLPQEENQMVTQMSRAWELKNVRRCLKMQSPMAHNPKYDVRLHMPLGVINNLKHWFLNPTEEDKKRFIEVTVEEDSTILGDLDFSGHELHVVVSEQKYGKWTYKNPKPFQYRLGEIYDIKDSEKKYFEGFIRAINERSYSVHFVNWSER